MSLLKQKDNGDKNHVLAKVIKESLCFFSTIMKVDLKITSIFFHFLPTSKLGEKYNYIVLEYFM